MDSDAANLSGNITVPETAKEGSKFGRFMALNMALSNPVATEWIRTRKQNIRPWLQFVNTGKFGTPTTVPIFTHRFVKNIEYFLSNYLFVFLGLFIFCLLTSPLLLIALGITFGACYIVRLKNAESKFALMGHEVSLAQQYMVVFICSIPLFYLVGATGAVFWVIGASFFVIALHATFFAIETLPIDDDKFELLQLETV